MTFIIFIINGWIFRQNPLFQDFDNRWTIHYEYNKNIYEKRRHIKIIVYGRNEITIKHDIATGNMLLLATSKHDVRR